MPYMQFPLTNGFMNAVMAQKWKVCYGICRTSLECTFVLCSCYLSLSYQYIILANHSVKESSYATKHREFTAKTNRCEILAYREHKRFAKERVSQRVFLADAWNPLGLLKAPKRNYSGMEAKNIIQIYNTFTRRHELCGKGEHMH